MSLERVDIAGRLTLETVASGLRFRAEVEGWTFQLDSGADQQYPTPVQSLIAALAACVAMDVISILRKKRLHVSGYVVEFRGQRATEHPKRFVAIEIAHRVSGRGVPPSALAEAIQLSDEKYCTVRHSLRPDIQITWTHEVVETP